MKDRRYSSFINNEIDAFAVSAEEYGDDVAVVGLAMNIGVDSLGLTFMTLTGTIVRLGD